MLLLGMAISHFLVRLAFLAFFLCVISANLDGTWYDAHATFYGDINGGETMRKYKLSLSLSHSNSKEDYDRIPQTKIHIYMCSVKFILKNISAYF